MAPNLLVGRILHAPSGSPLRWHHCHQPSIGESLYQMRLPLSERAIIEPLWTAYAKVLLWLWGAKWGSGLRVLGRLRCRLLGTLQIGHAVSIRSGYSNYVGGYRPMAICICPGSKLTIGDRCGLSNTAIVCFKEIPILEGTFIGGGCSIYDSDFHQLQPEDRLANHGEIGCAPIRIGPRAFLGGHSIVLKGVTIGEGAIIGAGSVVTRDVPPFEIWAGVPAKKIGEVAQQLRCER